MGLLSPDSPHSRVNRRNHYRTLYVQVDAPAEVIKSAYRTLMSRLRMHPDLGGDHEQAAWINEAYGVLSDPARRAEYDRRLRLRTRPEGLRQEASAAVTRPAMSAGPAAGPGFQPVHRTAQAAYAAWSVPSPAAHAHQGPAGSAATPPRFRCEFCSHSNPATGSELALCLRCGAPLTAVRAAGFQTFGVTGSNRRASARRPRNHDAVAYWSSAPGQSPGRHRVQWRDLSAHGLALWVGGQIAAGTRLHVVDHDLQTVAEVVACERRDGCWLLHGRLLTIQAIKRSGLFYNDQA